MLLYSDQPGPRFEYISRYILSGLCGFDITITYNRDEAVSYPGPVFSYGNNRITENDFHVQSVGLLAESGIRDQELQMDEWQQRPTMFPVSGGDMPFDIFSAGFYLISRYEEYLSHEKDEFGRYDHHNSFAYRKSFLHLPLVNIWALALRRELLSRFPSLTERRRSFRFIPTYDIDSAWVFRHKGWGRNLGGLIQCLLAGNWRQAARRMDVVLGKTPDPYDVYEWLDALHLRYSLKPLYFFLLARRIKGYDRNISRAGKPMKQLLAYHSAGYRVGIHPSWQSGDDIRLFEDEIRFMEDITEKPVRNSRFHYIRFNLPDDYRKLCNNGISNDYSMGYGSINGFRASVSTPFPWYDLDREEVSELMIHPYCWMDANSYYEQGFTPAQAFQEIKGYHDVVKKTEGDLMIISHNSFFSDEPGFAGWKQVYELFLDEVVYWDL